MNKVILMGRLTRDPDVRYTNSQDGSSRTVARFSIAVDRRYRGSENQPTADFFTCSVFGKQAEFAEKYLKQGTKILVTGRIQNDNYTNREGQRVYSVQVLVEELEFAESKAAAERRQESSAGGSSQAPGYAPAGDRDGFMQIPEGAEEDLPFT